MKVYIFQAALLCQGCGHAAIENVKVLHPKNVPALDALGFPLDESSYDSDQFPKGPYDNGGGEADTPQHCDHCGVFLENPLTGDGMLYVNTQAIPFMDEAELAWSEIADRADAAGKSTLAEWIRYYFAWGQ